MVAVSMSALLISPVPGQDGADLNRRFEEVREKLVELKEGLGERFSAGRTPEACREDLERLGVSPADLAVVLGRMLIVNGADSEVRTGDVFPRGFPGGRVAPREIRIRHLFRAGSRVRFVAEWRGSRVWVNPRRGSAGVDPDDVAANTGLLVHAAIHNWGLPHTSVQELLRRVPEAPYEEIVTSRFARDCFPEAGEAR